MKNFKDFCNFLSIFIDSLHTLSLCFENKKQNKMIRFILILLVCQSMANPMKLPEDTNNNDRKERLNLLFMNYST